MANASVGSWRCPGCQRAFSREGQSHSCKPAVPVDTFFEGRPPEFRTAYDALVKQLHSRVKMEAVGVGNGVHFVGKAAFAGVKVLRNVMRVEFLLDRPLTETRLLKSEKFSATRYAHHVEVRSRADVDEQLLDWLTQAAATRR